MVRRSSVMNQSQNRHGPRTAYSISASATPDAEMKYLKRSAARGQEATLTQEARTNGCGVARQKARRPPRHAETESEVPAQYRFHERSHRVALTAESTYAVAHVVPARSYRLRAAATLHTPGAAASRTQARAAGGL